MSHHQNSPTFLFDALYCEEEHWGNKNGEIINNYPEFFIDCSKHNFLWNDDEELISLLNKEQENELYYGLEKNPSLTKSRDEAVEWILKVIGYFSFSALTAVLAVNYFDRFLFSFQSYGEKPWTIQLAAVGCISLAAKVEETEVPLLLDLQVEESKYVFESKTIQKMEILILSTLEWKMNPVTPLSFLGYIARRLRFKNHLYKKFVGRFECLLLSLISDGRFMCYLPSALATATMLYVISSLEPCIVVEYQEQLIGIIGINKDKVVECLRVIEEVAKSVEFQSSNKRKFGSLPCSPKGVVDMSFSSNDSWELDSISSVSSSPEPLSKKIKDSESKS
ncbi:hypothetical protein RD792_017584 [Penstemon davidsonii]|uniref:Uncharacterized protein n=1 Tax=Penstemon davidsonii TaxID=160366 RepID=A0ABR0CN01_9LAMI|nr:hypothetical protein RD792_017584 [Penstemon davidsonii]